MVQHKPLKNVTPTDTTTAFLREVDEALQQEKLLAVWHKTKWFLLAAVIMLLLAIAGQQAWMSWKQHQARTMAEKWYAYSVLTKDSERQKQLPEVLQATAGGTHALAVYALANMQHTPEEKAKAYQQVMKDSAVPDWMRDLARLNAAIALMPSKPADAKAQLELLAQEKAEGTPGPAYAPALELLSLMAQESGDNVAALGYTQKLLEQPGLPSDMRQRALQRFGALGGKAS